MEDRGLQSHWDESSDLSKCCKFYCSGRKGAERASVQINSGQSMKEFKGETFMGRSRKGLSEGVKKQHCEAQNCVVMASIAGTIGSLTGTTT